MNDRIYHSFLERQREQALALSAASDVVQLYVAGAGGLPLSLAGAKTEVPDRYVALFTARTLVRGPGGVIVPREGFAAGFFFPSDYCRHALGPLVVCWLGPENAFNPHIVADRGFICCGRLAAGTPLVDLVELVHSIATYRTYTLTDALDQEAANWARTHLGELPVDHQPLRRRAVAFRTTSDAGGPPARPEDR